MSEHESTAVAAHLELTRRVDAWLRSLNGMSSETAAALAVDLADMLHAAAGVRTLLEELLVMDVSTSEMADLALRKAADLEVQLQLELKDHLLSFEQLWPEVLDALERTEHSS